MIGCVLAVFVPTFFQQIRLSRTAEAAELLAEMHRGASAYFQTPQRTALGVESRRCVPAAAGPYPAPSADGVEVDFGAPGIPGAESYAALGFAVDRPVRFAYSFEPTVAGCDLRSPEGTYLVSYRAEGDLDDDGDRSLYERRARALDDRDELVPVGVLYVRDAVE